MKRRQFLQAGLSVAGSFTLGQDFWKRAYAAPAQPGPSPYGELVGPDENGLYLPPGFTSRKIAEAYSPVQLANGGESTYIWHRAPDGGAVIPQDDGGWVYVSNSEIPIIADECFDDPNSPMCGEQGGVGAVRFDADGQVIDAYPVLQGTNNNCAGGLTPWGTWLSCEENFFGFVYECDPTGLNAPIRLPGLGQFAHEAAAVDPVGKAIYLTEDQGDGAFYRFRPAIWPDDGRPDLTLGVLEVAVVGDNPPLRVPYGEELRDAFAQAGVDFDDFDPTGVLGEVTETEPGSVTWVPILNPLGLPIECRYQVPTAAIFDGGEGCWYDSGLVYFTCKGSNRVWYYDTAAERMEILYDANEIGDDAPLRGVDNMVVHAQSHDLYVAEDGGNMELVVITDDRTVAPFMRYPVPHSEIAGPGFDASGTRLYFASQAKRHRIDEATGEEVRGEIFEITGPFRNTVLDVPDTPEEPTDPPEQPDEPTPDEPVGDTPPPITIQRSQGGSLGMAALGALGAAALLSRLSEGAATDETPAAEDDAPDA